MKKLFEVIIENTIYVMAENANNAEMLARANLEEEISCEGFCISPIEVTPSSHCVYPWHDAEPYGTIDHKTCGEIVKEMIDAEELRKIKEEADKRQLKFEFYEGTNNEPRKQ